MEDLAAIVPAAGASSRMGRHKALVEVDGVTLVAAHVRVWARRGIPVVVVVGCDREEIGRHCTGARVVENPDWETTDMAASLRIGLHAVPEARRIFVAPVDTVPAEPEVVGALLAALPPAIPIGPDGRAGHPAYLDALLVDRLRREAPPSGLQTWLVDAKRVAVPHDVSANWNTPDALERWLAAREHRR